MTAKLKTSKAIRSRKHTPRTKHKQADPILKALAPVDRFGNPHKPSR